MSDVVMPEGSGHRQTRDLGAGEEAANTLGKAVLPETICRQLSEGSDAVPKLLLWFGIDCP